MSKKRTLGSWGSEILSGTLFIILAFSPEHEFTRLYAVGTGIIVALGAWLALLLPNTWRLRVHHYDDMNPPWWVDAFLASVIIGVTYHAQLYIAGALWIFYYGVEFIARLRWQELKAES